MALPPKISSNWASLPRDLIDMILDHVTELPDFNRFCSVCKPWRSIALETNLNSHPQSYRLLWHHQNLLESCKNQLPVLLTPTQDEKDNERTVYSVTQGASYDIQLPFPYSGRFIGSSSGWLFTVDKSMVITLINPFLKKSFCLPKLELEECMTYRLQVRDRDDHDLFIRKAILLSQDNYPKVFLIYSWCHMGKLAYLDFDFDEGTEEWKLVELYGSRTGISTFADIICYKGLIYAVTYCGTLVQIDTSRSYGDCKIIANDYQGDLGENHLVESMDGDLLLVRRFEDYKSKANRIVVSKLRNSTRGGLAKWVDIKSIGEQALFLGDNSAVAVSTIDFPNCKSNCVYYVDQYFNILDSSIDEWDWNEAIHSSGQPPDTGLRYTGLHCAGLHHANIYYMASPSIWIVPNLKT